MSSLERGLEILAEIGTSGLSTVEQLSRRLGLPMSTTYRYVSTLRSLGFLTDHEGRYGPGTRLLHLVRSMDVDGALARLADPLLDELVYRTGETAILTVRSGTMAFCLYSIEPARPVRLSFARGATRPLHAGASAKPLLAYAEAPVVEALLRQELVKFTPHTPDAETLLRQLEQIRRTGVCVTMAEVDPDALGVGAPVFWGTSVVAALSVAGPVSRFDKAKVGETVALVTAAARALARVLDGAAEPHAGVSLMDKLHGDHSLLPGARAPLAPAYGRVGVTP